MVRKFHEVHSLASGASRYLANIFRIFYLRYAEGHVLKELKVLGLLSPEPGLFHGSTMIPARKFEKWRDGGNPREFCPKVDSKPNFYKLCREMGIRVPEVYAIGLPSIDILRSLPSAFLTKPVYGGGGFGVSAFVRDGSNYRSWDGAIHDEAGLVNHLIVAANEREVIFQERMFPTPVLGSFIQDALPTFRIVTCRQEDKVILLTFYLRIPEPGRLVDNLGLMDNRQSFIEMDLETGKALRLWRRDISGWGLVSSNFVDIKETLRVDSVDIPYFEAARDWAIRLSEANPNLRTIGWDIGLSNQGPVAIEGNSGWALPFLPSTMGRIRKVMGY